MPYQDVMNVIPPGKGHRPAHITGHDGKRRSKGPHSGSGLNNEEAASGVHP
jgi:hypothetical protein